MTNTENLGIKEIEALTESEASEFALERMTIKEHEVYFVDFCGYFGYSCLVFKDGHHIYHANDYQLHHRSEENMEDLRALYIKELNAKLYTEAEILEPVKSYDDYKAKDNFLRNYYGMRVDRVSAFFIGSDKEAEKMRKKTEGMTFDRFGFFYTKDNAFVKHHAELCMALENSVETMNENYDYLKSAYLYEMYNHEYGINWQADYDVLSCFGNVRYHDYGIEKYFEELNFNDVQKKAYLDARRQYCKETAANY